MPTTHVCRPILPGIARLPNVGQSLLRVPLFYSVSDREPASLWHRIHDGIRNKADAAAAAAIAVCRHCSAICMGENTMWCNGRSLTVQLQTLHRWLTAPWSYCVTSSRTGKDCSGSFMYGVIFQQKNCLANFSRPYNVLKKSIYIALFRHKDSKQ